MCHFITTKSTFKARLYQVVTVGTATAERPLAVLAGLAAHAELLALVDVVAGAVVGSQRETIP